MAGSNGDLTTEKVISYLRRDPFRNVVALKTLAHFPKDARAFFAQSGSAEGALVLLPTEVSEFDRQSYPNSRYVVMLYADTAQVLPELLTHLPSNCPLVFKLNDNRIAQALQTQYALTRVNAYISYSTQSLQSIPADPDVQVSDTLSNACAELFQAQAHPRSELDPYFISGDARSYSIYLEKGPVAACFSFRNFENVYEIGGVYTIPAMRRSGYARRVVAAALDDLQQRDKRPRYAVQEQNLASIQLAASLGLTPFVTTEHWLYTP